MTTIDKFNLIMTIISIIVTFISISVSIWASSSAKKAKQYKEETLQFRESFDLESLSARFFSESMHFQENVRDVNWYKGKDVNTIISPFKEVLASFGKLYHLVKDEKNLKDKVHELDEIVNIFDNANPNQRTRANKLILDINEILQAETHDNTSRMCKN